MSGALKGCPVDDILGLTDEEKDYYINRDMYGPFRALKNSWKPA